MANGHADDLATRGAARDRRPILLAPGDEPAHVGGTGRRSAMSRRSRADGFRVIGPNAGEMAESGEAGTGRMAEPVEIVAAVDGTARSLRKATPLAGKRILVTAGPTHEPIDPVRYIANRSSGKQGYAIARAAAAAGAAVTLVSGPVNLPDPAGVKVVRVESARDMLEAVEAALPADVAIFAAAVADWRVARRQATQKIKKDAGATRRRLQLIENPDILATHRAAATKRPKLVIGFAAETEKVIEQRPVEAGAQGLRLDRRQRRVDRRPASWAATATPCISSRANGVEDWPAQSKDEVAPMLVARNRRDAEENLT